jgi:ribonuclease HI
MTCIYTDGSCLKNPGPGGWAVVVLNKDSELNISGGEKYTTNNKMELEAVIKALEFTSGEVTIYSDSNYVIKGITEWIHNWKRTGWKKIKNKEYWIRLDEQVKCRKVIWNWVKAHNGDYYNEKVDKLARNEAENFKED